MAGEVQNIGLGDALIQAAKNISGSGLQQTDILRAMVNTNIWNGGFFGCCCGPMDNFYPIYGTNPFGFMLPTLFGNGTQMASLFGNTIQANTMNQTANNFTNTSIAANLNNANSDLMRMHYVNQQIDNAGKNILNGSYSTQSGQSAPLTTSNYANCFDSLSDENLKELSDLETEMEGISDKNSDEYKEKAAKYKSLQEEFSSSVRLPDKKYSQEKDFYQNLDKSELEQIQSRNAEIRDMQTKLEEMKKEYTEKQNELAKKSGNSQNGFGFMTLGTQMSEDDKAAMQEYQQEITEQTQEISDAINKLNEYIAKAGENKDKVNMNNFFATKKASEEKSAKASSIEKIGNAISENLIVDGGLQSKTAISNAAKKGVSSDYNTSINTAINILYEYAADHKDNLGKDLKDEDFFELAEKKLKGKSKEEQKKTLEILEKAYDDLAIGTFRENAKEAGKSGEALVKILG